MISECWRIECPNKLAFILWLADEEGPARANILFDANASMHLNTEGLEVLGINVAERIIDLTVKQEEQTGAD